MTDSSLMLHVLGAGELVRRTDGKRVFRAGKPLALLAYLANAPGRTGTAEYLIDLLWADLTPESADHAFRQAVWLIRQRLGADALTRERHGFRLTLDLPSDRDRFLAAIERGDLELAVDLYTGDFLTAVALPGAVGFEHWAETERQRLRLLFIRTAEMLVRGWLSAGRFRDAQQLARRLRDLDEINESAWRLLIESYLSAGDRVTAGVEATALERVLADSGRPPEPATRAALRRVTHGADEDTGVDRPGELVTELIGREADFGAVIEAWGEAQRGRGRHVHLSGAAGIGKSRLLRDVHTRLRATGATGLLIRANPGSRDVAFSFVGDVARHLGDVAGIVGVSPTTAATLVGLHPPLSQVFASRQVKPPTNELVRLRTVALVEAVRTVAAERPLALLVDDLQWIDADSLRILGAVLHGVDDVPVLVVTTARAESHRDIRRPDTVRLELAPLSLDDVTELVASLAELPDEPWAADLPAALYEASGGTPLVLLETLRLLLDQAVLSREAGCWRCADQDALRGQMHPGLALQARVQSLGAAERHALLTLALLGTPLGSRLLAEVAGILQRDVDGALRVLERRGLASRNAEGWAPAHDELASVTISGAGADERQAVHRLLGRAVARAGTADPETFLRAAKHLYAAGEFKDVRQLFRRRVKLRNRTGERRAVSDLAREFLGEDGTDEHVVMLVRSIPMLARFNLGRRDLVAAVALFLMIGVTAGLLAGRGGRKPDAVFLAVPFDDNTSLPTQIFEVTRTDWEPGLPIGPATRGDRVFKGLPGNTYHWMHARPGGDSIVYSRMTRDSGGVDLFLRAPGGGERRLTYAPGDDFYPTWSPDGRYLAFASARYSTESWNEIVVRDLEAGGLKRLTYNLGGEVQLYWSPDGARIAFLRVRTAEGLPVQLCWIAIDGETEDCHELASDFHFEPTGWRDAQTLIGHAVAFDSAPHMTFVDVRTWAFEHTAIEAGVALPSADGAWVACQCAPRGRPEIRWYLMELADPTGARPLRLPDWGKNYAGTWLRARAARYLDTLTIYPIDTVAVGAEHGLTARGTDQFGGPMEPALLQWRSLDTTIAVVGPDQFLRPVRPGTARVIASVGGWRRDTAEVTVVDEIHRPILTERWDNPTSQWNLFGLPLPSVIESSEGPALRNNGDGSFESGAYLRRLLSPRRGTGARARLSTPITKVHWQTQDVAFVPVPGDVSYPEWDREYERFPYSQAPICMFRIAYAEGPAHMNEAALFSSLGYRIVTVTDPQRSGAWYDLVVQLFPDGRCGFAIDGRVVWISPNPTPISDPVRVLLQGNSSDTDMLVGRVEVWEGVDPTVDWGSGSGGGRW